jgi:HEAT repeat protein
MIDHDDEDTRFLAADALMRIEPAAGKELISLFIQFLADEEGGWVDGAAEALGSIGPAASNAIPRLVTLMSRPASEPLTPTAAINLWRIDHSQANEVVPVLVKCLEEEIESIGADNEALAALSEIGPAAVSAVPILRRLEKHNILEIRNAATAAIKGITSHAAD